MAGTAASAAELRPVPWAVPVAGAGFGLALLAVLVAAVAGPVRLALLAAFAVATVAMARELRRVRRSRVLAWDGRGGWTLDGRTVSVAPASQVHPGLVVLVLREVPGGPGAAGLAGRPRVQRGRTSVHWVPRSAAAPEAFRLLKSQLRHGRVAPAAERPENTPC
jgi:hypothetical protein